VIAIAPGIGRIGTNLRGGYLKSLRHQLPSYGIPVVGPLALAGAIGLWRGPDPRRRRALMLWLVWSGVVAAVFAAFAFGADLPAQRLLGFDMALPALAAAGVAWGVRLIIGPGRVRSGTGLRRASAALLVAASIVGAVLLGTSAWRGERPFAGNLEYSLLATADRYVEGLPPGTPVIFVINLTDQDRIGPAYRNIRALTPGSRLDDLAIYLGDPVNLLAGRPSLRPGDPLFNEASRRLWPFVHQALMNRPVILALKSYCTPFRPLVKGRKDRRLAWGVLALRGPVPPPVPPRESALIPPPPSQPVSRLVGLAALVLAMLTVAGLGWSLALLPGRMLERIALAPGFGLATLVLGGVVALHLRISLLAGSGAAVAGGATVAGWSVFLMQAISRRRSGSASDAARPAEAAPAPRGSRSLSPEMNERGVRSPGAQDV
jgi:hypothetical protein